MAARCARAAALGTRLRHDVDGTLDEIPEKVDCVNIFRRPEYVPELVEAAIRIGAKAVWMQLDVVHEEAAKRARDAGLLVVEDRCLLIEHRRHAAELRA